MQLGPGVVARGSERMLGQLDAIGGLECPIAVGGVSPTGIIDVTSTLDPIGSCVHSVVPSLLSGDCAVTMPDPGDFERAGAQDDEMVLTVPTTRLEELMDGVYHFEEIGMGFRHFGLSVHNDFQQPPFYQEYFKRWDLEGR